MITLLVAAASALGGALAQGSPSGVTTADVLFRAAIAGFVPWVAGRARAWTWVFLTACAAAAAAPGWWRWMAVAGFVATAATSLTGRPLAHLGPVSAAVAMQALLRSDLGGFHGSSALLTAVAITPVLVSAYRASTRPTQRTVRLVTLSTAVALGAIVALATASATAGARHASAGVNTALDGLDAARAGDTA